MRQKEAQVTASIAQQQLDLSVDQFNTANRIWAESAQRAAQDAAIAIGVMQKARDAEQYAIVAQQAIAQRQQQLSAVVGGINAMMARAGGNWNSALSAAAGGVNQFSGSVKTAMREIYTIMGYRQRRDGSWVKSGPNFESTGYMGRHAEGYLGSFAKGATFTVGEAGPETVAILRNPRTHMLQGSAPSPTNINININGPVVRNDADISSLARAVADEVERNLSRKGQMLGLRSPAY